MLRIVIAAGLVLLSMALVVVSVFFEEQLGRWADVMGGLGTEITGIALTVAIVDWLLERKRLRGEVVRLGWELLHEIDHAVFVWQGGRREFVLDELIALVAMTEPGDSPLPGTQNLLVRAGVRARDAQRLHSNLLRFDRRLDDAIGALGGLAQLSELRDSEKVPHAIQCLRSGLDGLTLVLGQRVSAAGAGVARSYRDPSPDAQTRRRISESAQ